MGVILLRIRDSVNEKYEIKWREIRDRAHRRIVTKVLKKAVQGLFDIFMREMELGSRIRQGPIKNSPVWIRPKLTKSPSETEMMHPLEPSQRILIKIAFSTFKNTAENHVLLDKEDNSDFPVVNQSVQEQALRKAQQSYECRY
ncbi:hypothetical protein L6452_20075 [Arctium lappa]|uniref:Uncharacterized protein n=1 Tax=Arctium lappa TaxID=4217 RepID=A0ACB9BAC8_ARCLA|nr:hypothetical protein L6452_20075 [Arctium lappa]